MSREPVSGAHGASVVLAALEVAVREAVSAMDDSFGEQGGCGRRRRRFRLEVEFR